MASNFRKREVSPNAESVDVVKRVRKHVASPTSKRRISPTSDPLDVVKLVRKQMASIPRKRRVSSTAESTVVKRVRKYVASPTRKRRVSPTAESVDVVKRVKKQTVNRSGRQKSVKQRSVEQKPVGRVFSKYGIEQSLPPMTSLSEMFADLVSTALKAGLGAALHDHDDQTGIRLNVATMCSGTDSPIFALSIIQHELNEQGFQFDYKHLFSAEIEKWKQAFIARNFNPSVCFGDITEFKSGQG